MRLLRRMALGVVKSLEVEDASPTSAALMTLQRWMEKVAEKEVARITAKCQRYQERQGYVPRWVERGWVNASHGWSSSSIGVQMLLGIFSANGVLPLEFKPAYSVGDLLTQHLDELEQEAERKGGSSRCSPSISPRPTRWRCLPHDQPHDQPRRIRCRALSPKRLSRLHARSCQQPNLSHEYSEPAKIPSAVSVTLCLLLRCT